VSLPHGVEWLEQLRYKDAVDDCRVVESRVMTLRDYLNRRSLKASLVMVALVVASWIYASKQGWDSTAKIIAGFVGVTAIALSLFIMSRTRCPRCRQRIGYMDTRRRRSVKLMGLDYCRSCGLHLDEEMADSNRE